MSTASAAAPVPSAADAVWPAVRWAIVRDLTLAELRVFDVGRIDPASAYAGRFLRQHGIDGERVPTLAEVMALTRRAGNDVVRFNLETKIDPRRPYLAPDPEPFVRLLLAEQTIAREKRLAELEELAGVDIETLQPDSNHE